MYVSSCIDLRKAPQLPMISKEDLVQENSDPADSFIDDFTLTEWLAEGMENQKSTPINGVHKGVYYTKPLRRNEELEEQVTRGIERLYLRGEYTKEDLEAYYEELAEKAVKSCNDEKLATAYNRLKSLRNSIR